MASSKCLKRHNYSDWRGFDFFRVLNTRTETEMVERKYLECWSLSLSVEFRRSYFSTWYEDINKLVKQHSFPNSWYFSLRFYFFQLKHIINVTSPIHGARQGLEFCEMLLRPSRQNKKKRDGPLYLILHPFDGVTQREHFDLSCSVTWSTTSFWSTVLARKRQKGDVALVSLAMKLPTLWMLNPYLEWSCIFS